MGVTKASVLCSYMATGCSCTSNPVKAIPQKMNRQCSNIAQSSPAKKLWKSSPFRFRNFPSSRLLPVMEQVGPPKGLREREREREKDYPVGTVTLDY